MRPCWHTAATRPSRSSDETPVNTSGSWPGSVPHPSGTAGFRIVFAAGMAAALPGVIAANTTLPVIGVPVKGSVLDGVDALYSIIQMPPGIPVATVAINGAMNAAILAIQMLALSDEKLAEAFAAYKEGLKKKIVKANEELKEVKFEYKTN